MAKRIISGNGKGGVGKSTIINMLAIYLATYKKEPCLLIDLDPSNCTTSKQHTIMESDPNHIDGWLPSIHPQQPTESIGFHGRCSTADIFLGNKTIPYKTNIELLDILPAYSSLLHQIEDTLASEFKEKFDQQLEKWIQNEAIDEKYTYVLIDTPPVRCKITRSFIKFATHLIIPTTLEPYPIEGLFGMLQIWNQENLKRQKDNPLSLIGIIPNMFRKNVKIQQGYLNFLQKNAGASQYLIPKELDLCAVFSEIDHNRLHSKKGTVFNLPKKHKSRVQAEEICSYIFSKINEQIM